MQNNYMLIRRVCTIKNKSAESHSWRGLYDSTRLSILYEPWDCGRLSTEKPEILRKINGSF